MLRSGFTLIEMLAVVAIATILATIAVPAVMPSIKRGKINEAVGMIQAVSSQARQLALGRLAQASDFYGVVIVQPADSPAYVALTYGPTADPGTILGRDPTLAADDVTNPPVAKQVFNRNVSVWCAPGTTPANTRNAPTNPSPAEVELSSGQTVGWGYQYRTGACIDPTCPSNGAIAVGCGFDPNAVTVKHPITLVVSQFQWPSPIRDKLSLRSLDNRYRTAVAIYGSGLINVQDF